MRPDIISIVGIALTLLGLMMGHYYNKTNYKKESWKSKQDDFIFYRKQVKENRKKLVETTYKNYNIPSLMEDVPVLFKKSWFLETPILIDRLKLELDCNNSFPKDPINLLLEIQSMLPPSQDGRKNILFSDAILDLHIQPAQFVNRECYRLVQVQSLKESKTVSLRFALCNYFDHFNVGEALAHESAVLEQKKGLKKTRSVRRLIRDPFDLMSRCVVAGIATLTIRQEGKKSTFYMMERDGLKVASGMNNYHVIPAGEFQPSSKSPVSRNHDFDIWKNIMREYNEEFLGAEESFGDESYTTDYTNEPYKSMDRAFNNGQVKCYYLGVGMDPLNLKADLITVCVWDALSFDKVFRNMIQVNSEGKIIAGEKTDKTITGIPFEKGYIERYISEYETVPTAIACLKLAWIHKDVFNIE